MSHSDAFDDEEPGRGGVALLHPGAMGASLGAALVRAGRQVWWLPQGRSDATRRRAVAAGLRPADSWPALLGACDLVISICPPAAASTVAESFASQVRTLTLREGRDVAPRWSYLDANAISPARARQVAALVEGVGANFVDGDVVGPPVGAGRTCLYLSGPGAASVAARFAGAGGGESDGPEIRVLGDDPTAASALKMLYAGWTKASGALLLTLWAAAERAGVAQALLAEWQISQPDLPGRLEQVVNRSVPKAWRFAGEMDEIADTLEELRLPLNFHRAAAEMFNALAPFKDGPPPDMGEVLAVLARSHPPGADPAAM